MERVNLDTSFCMESGQVKAGEDKNDTYVKMLQEVVRVTAPIAYGIAAEYPNVISLVRGLRRHGPYALEDIEVCTPITESRKEERAKWYFRNAQTRTEPELNEKSALQ